MNVRECEQMQALGLSIDISHPPSALKFSSLLHTSTFPCFHTSRVQLLEVARFESGLYLDYCLGWLWLHFLACFGEISAMALAVLSYFDEDTYTVLPTFFPWSQVHLACSLECSVRPCVVRTICLC